MPPLFAVFFNDVYSSDYGECWLGPCYTAPCIVLCVYYSQNAADNVYTRTGRLEVCFPLPISISRHSLLDVSPGALDRTAGD